MAGTLGSRLGAIGLALVSGVMMSVQARVNAGLSTDLGSGAYSALWSFGSGLVLALVIALLMPSARQGFRLLAEAARERRITWWALCGGAVGGFYVLTQGLSAAMIGVALFTVATVAGQSVGGLVIDRWGIAGMPPRSITALRLIGTLLAIAAVVLAAWGKLDPSSSPLWAYLLPFIAGSALGWQQAVNGQVREVSGSGFTGLALNFLGGTLVLIVAAVIWFAVAGGPTGAPTEWWHLAGGAIGCLNIVCQIFAVRRLGVLLLGLCMIAGQLVTAVLLDLLLPVAGHPFDAMLLVGTVLALLAVIVTSARLPRRAARAA